MQDSRKSEKEISTNLHSLSISEPLDLIIASPTLPSIKLSGRGAVFTAYETIEMEASIMDGRTLEVQNILKEKT